MNRIITILLLLFNTVVFGQVEVLNQVYNNVNITREIRCSRPVYSDAEFERAVGILVRNMKFYTEQDARDYMAFIKILGSRGWYNQNPNERLLLLVEDTNWWFHHKYWDYD
jgi:hypothetical protein